MVGWELFPFSVPADELTQVMGFRRRNGFYSNEETRLGVQDVCDSVLVKKKLEFINN